MSTPTVPPQVVEIKLAELKTKGFTDSGVAQFSKTVVEYASAVLDRAVSFGEAAKAPGMSPEIGHDQVKGATVSIAKSFGTPVRSGWSIAGQVGEYLATAVAGVGGGHLDKKEGIIAFGLGVSIAVVLVVARLTIGKQE